MPTPSSDTPTDRLRPVGLGIGIQRKVYGVHGWCVVGLPDGSNTSTNNLTSDLPVHYEEYNSTEIEDSADEYTETTTLPIGLNNAEEYTVVTPSSPIDQLYATAPEHQNNQDTDSDSLSSLSQTEYQTCYTDPQLICDERVQLGIELAARSNSRNLSRTPSPEDNRNASLRSTASRRSPTNADDWDLPTRSNLSRIGSSNFDDKGLLARPTTSRYNLEPVRDINNRFNHFFVYLKKIQHITRICITIVF